MARATGLLLVCFLLTALLVRADEPKAVAILGKWELTEVTAKLPKGTVFDFRAGGKLVVTLTTDGQKKTFDCTYEVKMKEMRLAFTVGKKTDTTTIVILDEKELVCQDNDGTTPRFRRVK